MTVNNWKSNPPYYPIAYCVGEDLRVLPTELADASSAFHRYAPSHPPSRLVSYSMKW